MRSLAFFAALSAAVTANAADNGKALTTEGAIYSTSSPYSTSKEAKDHLGPPPNSCFDQSRQNICSIVFFPVGAQSKTGWEAAWGRNLKTICMDEETAERVVDCSSSDAVVVLPPAPLTIRKP